MVMREREKREEMSDFRRFERKNGIGLYYYSMMLEIMLDRRDPGREAATLGISLEALFMTPDDARLPFTIEPRRRVFKAWCTASLMLPRPDRRR